MDVWKRGKTAQNHDCFTIPPSVMNRLETQERFIQSPKRINRHFKNSEDNSFILSFRRQGKKTASHEGKDSNRDRVLQGDLVENT